MTQQVTPEHSRAGGGVTAEQRARLLEVADAVADQVECILDEDDGVQDAIVEVAAMTLTADQIKSNAESFDEGPTQVLVDAETPVRKELQKLVRNRLDDSNGEVWVSTIFFEDGFIDQEVLDAEPPEMFWEGLADDLASDEDFGPPGHGRLMRMQIRVGHINGGDTALVRDARRGL